VPERLTRAFVEKDGRRGRIVLVYPTLSTDAANGRAQILHTQTVREAARKVDPSARVAGQMVLIADIVQAITSDGLFTGLLSFLGVACITLLVMRSVRDTAWVIGSLSLGVLWMAGAMTLLSLKFNFVNFAVLPITFGIGVDYAVNLYQRYRQAGSVEEALASSGGAVALCSVTTIIGYATLVTADNQAIQSFGLTAVIGEVTCLSAALFALPAVLSLRNRRASMAPDGAELGA
jgi:predicted RND superfamily exporter protein